MKHKPLTRVGIILLILVFLMACFGPLLLPFTYYTTNLEIANQSPSVVHWFGTDDLGRDMFIRCCYGTRISLIIGVAAAFLDLIIGFFWGGFSALYGGKVDELMMRFADICYSLPYLLVVILITVILGPGLMTIIAALCITGWITMARVVRAQVLQLKQQDYVLASRLMGANHIHILTKHIIPNALSPIICTLTLTIPSAIFAEAFLSFLGLGVQAPNASLGTMASEGLPALEYYPWRILFPLSLISTTMLGFNLIGDALGNIYEQE